MSKQTEPGSASAPATGSPLVRARKPHRCDYCGQRIEVGEQYDRVRGYGSDGPWTLKQHPECAAETVEWGEDEWHVHFPGDEKRPVKAENHRINDKKSDSAPVDTETDKGGCHG